MRRSPLAFHLGPGRRGGITFLDTADVYPLGGGRSTVGRTEEIVGRWLQGKRDRFVVATKCVGRTGGAAWDQGSSRKHIVEAVEASLRRLGVDRIDLYQLKGELDEITHHYRLGDAAR